jgi:hypothetical protein
MANDDDLTFGHGRDELLERLYEIMPSLDLDEAADMVAGVIWLDTQLELRQEGDYILVNPGAGAWLLMSVSPTDPQIARAVQMMDPSIEEKVSKEPFEVKFTCPEGSEHDNMFPEFIRGQTVLMRIMNETEAQRLGFVVTVRADGAFITLPASNEPANVNEL